MRQIKDGSGRRREGSSAPKRSIDFDTQWLRSLLGTCPHDSARYALRPAFRFDFMALGHLDEMACYRLSPRTPKVDFRDGSGQRELDGRSWHPPTSVGSGASALQRGLDVTSFPLSGPLHFESAPAALSGSAAVRTYLRCRVENLLEIAPANIMLYRTSGFGFHPGSGHRSLTVVAPAN